MVSPAGLYWHSVDVVWVFVFRFFYPLQEPTLNPKRQLDQQFIFVRKPRSTMRTESKRVAIGPRKLTPTFTALDVSLNLPLMFDYPPRFVAAQRVAAN